MLQPRQLQLREVRELAPGSTVGAVPFPTAMLLFSVKKMICEECLAYSWLESEADTACGIY